MNYRKRIVDELLERHREAFGATLIVGPKGCGKTTSAAQVCATKIEFQDEEKRAELLLRAENAPSKLLDYPKPILFDEWQDAPKLWGTVRKACDDNPDETGAYLLTGSSSKNVGTPHTGTMRISRLTMYPMSLWESGESDGKVSLSELFDNPSSFDGCESSMSLDEIIFAICRGGWPRSLNLKTDRAKLLVAGELFREISEVDISSLDGTRRSPESTKAILRSYARNICTPASTNTILKDVASNHSMSRDTFDSYVDALERLYIIKDITAWCPAIRSKAAIRSAKKRNFIDPSIAVAALGLSPGYFNRDFKTLGFLFESLAMRDLQIYSSLRNGEMSYYRDRYGLEADGVLHLSDGRSALIEFKLGGKAVGEGARHLNEIERLIQVYNKTEKQCPITPPSLKIVITAGRFGERLENGVFVIPLACLRP